MNVKMEDFLEHYGVKGMHWGIRKKDQSSGRRRSGQKPQVRNPKLVKEFESFSDKQKYGSMNDPQPKIEDQGFFKSLTPAQKHTALIFGGAAVVAGLAYAVHTRPIVKRGFIDPQYFLDGKDPLDNLAKGYSEREGLLAYRDKGITMPAGSLVARVSSAKETNIRPGGFYAAHEIHDIEYYQTRFGRGLNPYTNYYKATKEIKAPSTTEYLKILGQAMDHPKILKERSVDPRSLRKLTKAERDTVLYKLATQELYTGGFPYSLNASYDGGLLPERFKKLVLSSGYTSVIDYNNTLVAQAPMRHLDGSMFKLFKHEPLTQDVIQLAVANEPKNLETISNFYDNLVHSLVEYLNEQTDKGGFMPQDITDFLEHYGVKGMRWGVHRSAGGSSGTPKRIKRERTTARTRYNQAPKRLTDAELQARIKRMETEKRYNDLNKRTVGSGQKHAMDVLSRIGKETAATLGIGASLYGAKKLIGKKVGQEKLELMYPKKKK